MRNKKIVSFFFAVIIFSACKTTKQSVSQQAVTLPTNTTDQIASAKLFTAAFQQSAAEYKALCYQTYNLAKIKLDELLITGKYAKPLAVMTDIDETVLNNSPYQVHQALLDKDYDPTSWHLWTDKASADTVPGALSFFQYAASRGVEVFYVTNRDNAERASTLKNLQNFNFPNTDNSHLMLMGKSSSKVQRRDSIQATHILLMQFGDNLNDFSGSFEKKSIADRMKATDEDRSLFGTQFFVLPNPSYGEWENAVYKYQRNLTSAQKDSIYRSILKNW